MITRTRIGIALWALLSGYVWFSHPVVMASLLVAALVVWRAALRRPVRITDEQKMEARRREAIRITNAKYEHEQWPETNWWI